MDDLSGTTVVKHGGRPPIAMAGVGEEIVPQQVLVHSELGPRPRAMVRWLCSRGGLRMVALQVVLSE